MADHVVDVPHVKDVVGLSVVGAEGQPVQAGEVLDPLPDGGDVAGDGGVPGVDVDAGAHLVHRLLAGGGLVAGPGAAHPVGGDHPPGLAGEVALQVEALLLGGGDDVHHPLLALDHPDKVHHLGQAVDVLQLGQPVDGGGVKGGPGVFQSGDRGDAGGDVDELAHGQAQGRVVHVVDRLLPGDVGDLVGVGDGGGGAVGQDGGGEVAGGQHRTLHVDVGVDEAGHQGAATPVVDLFGQVQIRLGIARLHVGHKPLVDKDGGGVNLAGEDVDVLDVGDGQVAGDAAQGRLQQGALVVGLVFHLFRSPFLFSPARPPPAARGARMPVSLRRVFG